MREWEHIVLGGAVITGLERGHYDTVVAYGHLHGGPFAAVIDPERGVQVLDVPGSDPVLFAAVAEQIQLATGGVPPLHLVADQLPGYEGRVHGPFKICRDVDTGDLVRYGPSAGTRTSRSSRSTRTAG